MVKVDDLPVWVSSEDGVAGELEKIELGATVRIVGHLVEQRWPRERAGEGRKLVVRADAVELLEHPVRNDHVIGGDVP